MLVAATFPAQVSASSCRERCCSAAGELAGPRRSLEKLSVQQETKDQNRGMRTEVGPQAAQGKG